MSDLLADSTGSVAVEVTAAGALVAVFTIYQAFWPLAQCDQFALILFWPARCRWSSSATAKRRRGRYGW